MKLNLGGGNTHLEGYVNIDRASGGEVYPLDAADDSVDEIYASHILEHFGHRETLDVLKHWVQKLKPGGRIRLAVPDFEWICEQHYEKKPINTVGFVMGGQTDENDFHKALFNQDFLCEMMAKAGLEQLRKWTPEVEDCSSLPCSLNMQGTKPRAPIQLKRNDAVAVLSAPRFGPISHFRHAYNAFYTAKVPYRITIGAFWHQVLAEAMESFLELTPKPKYIFTVDYDTIFTSDHVQEMYRLMEVYSDYDCLCPVHMKRNDEAVLVNVAGRDGKVRQQVALAEFDQDVLTVCTGHFGLTIFRTESLARLPRPWFMGRPNKDARWGPFRRDPDMAFWDHWCASGFKLGLANRVIVGHIQEMIVWPDKEFHPLYQTINDYDADGMPPEARQ